MGPDEGAVLILMSFLWDSGWQQECHKPVATVLSAGCAGSGCAILNTPRRSQVRLVSCNPPHHISVGYLAIGYYGEYNGNSMVVCENACTASYWDIVTNFMCSSHMERLLLLTNKFRFVHNV